MHGICLASSNASFLWLSPRAGNELSASLVREFGRRIKHTGLFV